MSGKAYQSAAEVVHKPCACSAKLKSQKHDQAKMSSINSVLHKPSALQFLSHLQSKPAANSNSIHAIAKAGTQGQSAKLPHSERIQQSFGKYDISAIQAYLSPSSAAANHALGSSAYATGTKIAFASQQPSLFTAAHEAAHYVQQQAGVHLKDGVGNVGDHYEQHADAVASLVTQGKSAETLLDQYRTNKSATHIHSINVQKKLIINNEVIKANELSSITGYNELKKHQKTTLKAWARDIIKPNKFKNSEEAFKKADKLGIKTLLEKNFQGNDRAGYFLKDKTLKRHPFKDFSKNRIEQALTQLSSILFSWLDLQSKRPVEVQAAYSKNLNSIFIATNNPDSSRILFDNIKPLDPKVVGNIKLTKGLTKLLAAKEGDEANKPIERDNNTKQSYNEVKKRKHLKFYRRYVKQETKDSSKYDEKLKSLFKGFDRDNKNNKDIEDNKDPKIMQYPPEGKAFDDCKSMPLQNDTIYIITGGIEIENTNKHVHAERNFLHLINYCPSIGALIIAGLKLPCYTCNLALNKNNYNINGPHSKIFPNQLYDIEDLEEFIETAKNDTNWFDSKNFGYDSLSDYDPDE